MPPLPLSTLAILLGLLVCVPHVYGLLKPDRFGAAMRKFPRSLPWGYALMLLGTAWFLYNLSQESIADFAAYKKFLVAGFAAIGIGACVYVKDFLAIRGLAVVMLLLAKLMVDSGRPHLAATHWVLVIQVWAYLMVLGGMWLTISPWRARDLIEWATANRKRLQAVCAVRVAFGLFILALGLTVFRPLAAP
ncbi:MAG TPA: hypothetical protein PKX23_09785 [Verrucomicrobiota bacterium]|nr:hypothetical protein [Verrucomicrobiota bacterium]HRT07581.1 hypothetical protein [Candidatus Paceibacterota bacterium]HRT57125.1 hypothetical protein [Candidatus Paceibacterota bacterium]